MSRGIWGFGDTGNGDGHLQIQEGEGIGYRCDMRKACLQRGQKSVAQFRELLAHSLSLLHELPSKTSTHYYHQIVMSSSHIQCGKA